MSRGAESSGDVLPRPFPGVLAEFRDALARDRDVGVRLEEGQRFGAYRVAGVLGAGGMGTVHRAVRDDGRQVALKVARTDRARSDVLGRRLRNEAEALGGLRHPNIARFIDSGEVDGVFYLVTEFIEGPDLLTWSRREAPSARRAMELAAQLAGALRACHEHRVLHRDLSPSNVVIHPDGRPVLVDFGLCLDLAGRLPYAGLTKTDHVAGKYAYIPPESAQGAGIDERWDIYAFGGCLYAMVTGQEFDPRQLHDLYPALNARDDPFMGKLKLIARKCLARRPEHRFASAARLEDALRHARNPPPRWRALVLTGIAVTLILGLFTLTQVAGGASGEGASPIRFWSHGLHFGLVTLLWVRTRWLRDHGDHRLELSRFMPFVWMSFAAYYGFNMWSVGTGASGDWVGFADAMISNATGVALLFAFTALWLPTRRGDDGRERPALRRASVVICGVWTALLAVALLGTLGVPPFDGENGIIQTVLLPSSLFVGASLCALVVGLGQKTLQAPVAALIALITYGLVQLFYPAFPWIAEQGEGWLIGVYGFGMVGKLALFVAFESIVRSWSLFGYEGQLSQEW